MINNKSEYKLLCDYGFSPFFKLLACSTSLDRQPFSLTIMHTGNLVRTDRMLSPSLSLPCKHATVKAIMYPAAVHRGSAPEQESSTRSSNGLKRRFYAGGRMQGIEPKYHPNYSSDQLSACLAGWDTAPSSSPWGDANAVQVLHLLQEPWASFLAVQSQTRPASLLSP